MDRQLQAKNFSLRGNCKETIQFEMLLRKIEASHSDTVYVGCRVHQVSFVRVTHFEIKKAIKRRPHILRAAVNALWIPFFAVANDRG